MSAAPDPAELAPSRDPAAYGRRPLFTAGFFAWVAICVACVAAGAAIGRLGLTLTPAKSEPATAEAPARPAAEPTPAALPDATPAPPVAPAKTSPALADRLQRLESSSSRLDDAAVRALAAASLSTAAEGSGPFDQELAAYERLAPADTDLRALAPLAALGAPSRAALAADFPDLASLAAAASRQPAKDAGLLAKLSAMLGRVIIVRRVGADAPGVDGVLYRAEVQASAGDLEDALATLRALPAPARAPLRNWIAAAERRVEIDRRIDAVRAGALAALAAPTAAGA